MMKKFQLFLFLFVSTVVLFIGNSCRPDVIVPEGEGTLTLHFNPMVDGVTLIPQSGIYTNSAQHVRFQIDMLQFYICDITIKRDDDSIIILNGPNHVGLIKVMDIINKDFSFKLPSANYKSIGFTLGLNSALNATQPSDYATDHPLGIDNGNYWLMNSSYVFVKLEGLTDTTASGSGSLTNSFVYHIGTNDLAPPVSYTKNFSITKDNSDTINVNMDVLAIFNGVTTIDMRTEVSTNTTDDLPLAQKFINNFVHSITIP
jgi:hypothetical protein